MKIVFISNFFNHHQSYLSDSLYKLTNENYYFIETIPMPDSFKKTGYKIFQKNYIIKSYISNENYLKSLELIKNADVVIIGSASYNYIKDRVNCGKLVFRYSERIFKNLITKLESPVRMIKYLYEGGNKKNVYLLCASAYASRDFNSLFCYKNRCFKWGYFPQTPKLININKVIEQKEKNSILWVGRLINWKHPEDAIKIAKKLKQEGYKFHLNIIGNGVLKERLTKMITDNNLKNEVSLLGNIPSDKVQNYMKNSKIFLATSDYNEGWGAVVNEAMGNACAIVGNSSMGSIPYLIKDRINGFTYNNGNLNELLEKVKFLLENSEECNRICNEAYNTINHLWNGKEAAIRFINISENILNNDKFNKYEEGPCGIEKG